MLTVEGLVAGHGSRPVVHDVDLTVGTGDVVALLGANGVGKTTLLQTIAGLLPALGGHLALDGTRIDAVAAHHRARAGLVLVPDGHGCFPAMDVEENLQVVVVSGSREVTSTRIDEMFELFPRLAERRRQAAGTLSGGERQMLAIARALVADPKVLMLDEPSHGLAPILVDQLGDTIAEIGRRIPVLLVEQNLSIPSRCATQALVLEKGAGIVARGPAPEILASPTLAAAYLGR